MLALNDGRPVQMNLKELLAAFVGFREEVVTRRTKFELTKARDRGHILVGLAVAVANIDEVIRLIRAAPDAAHGARTVDGAGLAGQGCGAAGGADRRSAPQGGGGRHHPPDRGTGQGDPGSAPAAPDRAGPRRNQRRSRRSWARRSRDYLDILSSRGRVLAIIKDELAAIRDEFATPRKTELIDAEIEIEDEALIEREDVAVTVTHAGYIKRTPLAEYRVQGRGGKGRSGMATRDEDFVTSLFVASTHAPMLFFSSTGMAYKLKVWRLPEARIAGKGKAMVNLLPLAEGERITTILALPENEARVGQAECGVRHQVGRCAAQRSLSDFVQVNKNGKIAMKLAAGDGIVGVATCTDARRFPAHHPRRQVHPLPGRRCARLQGPRFHRRARHQAGERRRSGQPVAALSFRRHQRRGPRLSQAGQRRAPRRKRRGGSPRRGGRRGCGRGRRGSHPDAGTLCGAGRARAVRAHRVGQTGFGKRTSSYEYRVTGRGGSGIVAIGMGKKNSAVIAAFPVEESDDLMLISDAGQTIRVAVSRHFHPGPRRPGRHRVPGGRGRAGGFGGAHRRCRRRTT